MSPEFERYALLASSVLALLLCCVCLASAGKRAPDGEAPFSALHDDNCERAEIADEASATPSALRSARTLLSGERAVAAVESFDVTSDAEPQACAALPSHTP